MLTPFFKKREREREKGTNGKGRNNDPGQHDEGAPGTAGSQLPSCTHQDWGSNPSSAQRNGAALAGAETSLFQSTSLHKTSARRYGLCLFFV